MSLGYLTVNCGFQNKSGVEALSDVSHETQKIKAINNFLCLVLVMLLLSRFSRVRLCATHRWQPTRLLCPWDSPGKNSGVGCHFLIDTIMKHIENLKINLILYFSHKILNVM